MGAEVFGGVDAFPGGGGLRGLPAEGADGRGGVGNAFEGADFAVGGEGTFDFAGGGFDLERVGGLGGHGGEKEEGGEEAGEFGHDESGDYRITAAKAAGCRMVPPMNRPVPELQTKTHYEILDGLRGVAAFMVVIFHTFEAYADDNRFTQKVNHGYLAVDFFFLLSGFVVAYAYDDRWGGMTQWEFYKRRLIRLQPMVVMGSVIGAALFYFGKAPMFPLVAVTPVWKMLLVMVLGFTLLPLPVSLDIRGWQEMHPLDGPAWSLFYEYVANLLYGGGGSEAFTEVAGGVGGGVGWAAVWDGGAGAAGRRGWGVGSGSRADAHWHCAAAVSVLWRRAADAVGEADTGSGWVCGMQSADCGGVESA